MFLVDINCRPPSARIADGQQPLCPKHVREPVKAGSASAGRTLAPELGRRLVTAPVLASVPPALAEPAFYRLPDVLGAQWLLVVSDPMSTRNTRQVSCRASTISDQLSLSIASPTRSCLTIATGALAATTHRLGQQLFGSRDLIDPHATCDSPERGVLFRRSDPGLLQKLRGARMVDHVAAYVNGP